MSLAVLDPPRSRSRATYRLAPEQCAAEFVVRHHLFGRVRGRIRPFAGELHVGRDATRSWVRVDLDPTVLDTGDAERDAMLRSRFAGAGGAPVVRFESTEVVPASAGALDVYGDLYVGDAVGEIVLRTRVVEQTDDRVVIAGRGSFSRSAFGLTWDRQVERYGVAVADRVQLFVAAEFVR